MDDSIHPDSGSAPHGIGLKLAAWLLPRLTDTPASRRAFDETLADWHREGSTAKGLAAVARVIAACTWREAVSRQSLPALARIGVVLVVLLVAWFATALVTWGPHPTMLTWQVMAGMVSIATMLLPLAILLALGGIPLSRQPRLGMSAVILGAAAILVFVVTPHANSFLVAVPAESATPLQTRDWQMVVRNAWPMSSLDYLRLRPFSANLADFGDPYGRGWSAIFQINLQLAYAALCFAAVWLGSALGRTGRGVRMAMVAQLALLVLYQDRISVTLTREWWPSIFLATWIPTLACVAGYLMISRRADSATSSTALVPTVK